MKTNKTNFEDVWVFKWCVSATTFMSKTLHKELYVLSSAKSSFTFFASPILETENKMSQQYIDH